MTMHEIEKKLISDILLFDGAMGTMLMERGIKAGETAETWVLDHPDEIEAVHGPTLPPGPMLRQRRPSAPRR